MIVWVDGVLLDEEEVRISPFDRGLLTGVGAFETLRVYAGVPFAWSRHLARLGRSAAGLGLRLPDPAALRKAALATLERNALSDARLRITLTGGRAPLGAAWSDGAPSVIVAATALAPLPPVSRVVIAPWPRNERGALAGIKSTSYAENQRALALAAERGADEAVFANTLGNLCEGTASNVFLVEAGRVVTPPLAAGCLAGVTRELVLALCRDIGAPAVEADRPIRALEGAEESFLTSTTREIQPIAAVGERSLPAAGATTAALVTAYRDLVRADPDP